MFKTKSLLGAAIAALALAGAASMAHAAEPLTLYKGELPTVLKYANASAGLEVYKKFDAAPGALDGWVVKDKASGKNVVIYTTKDGTKMLAGMMIDQSGKNLTAEYTETHVPPPDYTPAFSDFTSAPSVLVGNKNAKAEITVAFDANCGFCKLMHKMLAPAIDAGELRVRYVPVAILGQDSDIKAAGILAAKDPLSEINAAAAGRGMTTSSDKALLAKVTGNTQLMRKHGFNGTPTVLYKGKHDGDDTIFIANGVPNMMELFKRLGISGQVDKLKADPSLSRYLN
ncbi:hypothetical protein LMG26857_03483 [Achromobacter anxifer]|uniref:thiol:disulfide interchange protein DsbG n=1 Tax=Achromobacter anxifer TaxID=1287737 RepID=UPI00155C8E5B|nr:thiol:disulfide interchange protein DsbG [Achromobacter anxifer]CAB5514424.1 hypothetical protein LMG26857_03483 [Achromobacter anxifer]